MVQAPASRYRPSLIALHWLTLVLLVAVYATMELRGFFPRGSAPRAPLMCSHIFLGRAAFFVPWLRVALRATSPTAPITPEPPTWQVLLARGVALPLYALMRS